MGKNYRTVECCSKLNKQEGLKEELACLLAAMVSNHDVLLVSIRCWAHRIDLPKLDLLGFRSPRKPESVPYSNLTQSYFPTTQTRPVSTPSVHSFHLLPGTMAARRIGAVSIPIRNLVCDSMTINPW